MNLNLEIFGIRFGLIDPAYLQSNKEDLSVNTAKLDFGKGFLVQQNTQEELKLLENKLPKEHLKDMIISQLLRTLKSDRALF